MLPEVGENIENICLVCYLLGNCTDYSADIMVVEKKQYAIVAFICACGFCFAGLVLPGSVGQVNS
jgi:hypothetical protein